MRLELRDLRVKATKLELRVKALTQNSHKAADKKDNLVTPASTQEDLIGLYARKFGTMNEFYVPCEHLWLQGQPMYVLMTQTVGTLRSWLFED